jgi:non-ribosomal peptide synthase protein (TIGR01720 family)
LRQVPKKGIGYGILKYLTNKEHLEGFEFKEGGEINFNYLGQFDADVEKSYFQVAKESSGESQRGGLRRLYGLEVIGIITEGKLEIKIIYDSKQYNQLTIEGWGDTYKSILVDIINYCSKHEMQELTPSDFTYKNLNSAELDVLQSLFN